MSALNLVGARRWLFLGSGLVVAASLVLLAIPPTLRPGIEFTSGTTTLVRFEQDVEQRELREIYAELGHAEARIQSTGENEFLIRTSELDVPEGSFEVAPAPAVPPVGPTPVSTLGTVRLGAVGAEGDVQLQALVGGDDCVLGDDIAIFSAATEALVLERHDECGEGAETLQVLVGSERGYVLASETHGFVPVEEEEQRAAAAPPADQGERTLIENEIEERLGAFEVLEFASVSPVVSRVAVRNAAVAVVVASLFIMGYIAFAFSSVPRPLRYATCAIVALLHDTVIVLGAFSLFGKLFGIEINLMFVTGLLTVIGFSVHDSIVVFDRIRENVSLAPTAPLAQNVNAALAQTLARSFNTSVTLLFTVLALLLLGGVTIQSFLLVILVGVVAGTYSSIGVAAQLLVAWEEGDFGRALARLRGRRREEAAAA